MKPTPMDQKFYIDYIFTTFLSVIPLLVYLALLIVPTYIYLLSLSFFEAPW